MILQRKEIEECIYGYKKTKFSLQVMTADYYDDTTNLKLFIRMFNFFHCSNQTGTTSVIEIRYFDTIKCILKQMQCRI